MYMINKKTRFIIRDILVRPICIVEVQEKYFLRTSQIIGDIAVAYAINAHILDLFSIFVIEQFDFSVAVELVDMELAKQELSRFENTDE